MDERVPAALLGNTEHTAALLEGWAASRDTLPEGPLFFLDPSYLAAAAREAGLDPDLAAAHISAARRIAANPVARSLARHVYYRLFRAPTFDRRQARRWPAPTAILGEDAGLFYLLALLGGLPELRLLYRAHALPDVVARETLGDMQRWADHYRRHHGVWGIAPSEVPWFRLHLRGELYGLGRLQFEPGLWFLEARVFRRRDLGAVTALAEGGIRYRPDGRRAGPDDPPDLEGVWTARLELGKEWVIGHRITPAGSVQHAVTRLARAEWAEVLKPGDPVLYLHIPRGAPLNLEACRRSLARALAFFPQHFPERSFVAFACESWLLDPQLEQLLPASSNLVRFQRQMYVVPMVGDQADALDWIFDGAYTDPARASRDTVLRRAVLDHLRRGGRLRGGGCFLLFEDLPAWGTDPYREPHDSWAPTRAIPT